MEEEVVLGDIIVGITESGVAYLQDESVSYDYQMDVSNVQVVTGQFVTAGTPICDVILTNQDDYQDAYDSQLATLERQLDAAYTSLSIAQSNAELDRIKAADNLAENKSAIADVEESNYINQFGWNTDLQEFNDTLNDLNEQRNDLLIELYEGYNYSDYDKKIEDYEDQIADIQDSIDDLYDDAADYDDQIDEVKDQIDTIEDEISDLEKDIKKAQNNGEETADLEKQLESKQVELSAAEKSKDSLKDAANKAEDDLDDRIEDLENQIDDINETMDEAEVDLWEAVADWAENLNDQIQAVDDNIAKTNTALVLEQDNPNATFAINDAGSTMDAALASAETLSLLLMAVAAIVFLVGGIGIMNVLFVSVKERTREIGVLRAIGTKKRDILLLFLVEANAMGMIGGILGVLLSFALLPLLEYFAVSAVFTPYAAFLAFAFAVVTGTLFGLYPAWKASNLLPIKALQNE